MIKVKGWESEILPDDNDREVSISGQTFSLFISDAELVSLLDAYEPSSGTSPPVGDCRPIVRTILNALLEG